VINVINFDGCNVCWRCQWYDEKAKNAKSEFGEKYTFGDSKPMDKLDPNRKQPQHPKNVIKIQIFG